MSLPPFKKPNKQTTDRMLKVLRKGTDLERSMALILKRERIKFRSQPKVKGNPDFRILGTRIIVFCDSSFWHGRWFDTPKAERFHKNHEFWRAKLLRNRSRDRRVSRDLRKRGWVVLRLWDKDIFQHPRRVGSGIRKTITRYQLN
jgi:DNA mismatch endonuclease (patch repair protein)